MHTNNRKWLDDLAKTYPENFNNAKVLEVGSRDWNGSVRPWFTNGEYIGIDVVDGEGVDQVISAEALKWDGVPFDTIISFSVLEHDNNWQTSLQNISQYLKSGGMLFMCWGAEGNIEHNPPWVLVPHQDVLDYLPGLGFDILSNFFEEVVYGKDCAGCYNVIAKKK